MIIVSISILFTFSVKPSIQQDNPPNIVFIMADDHAVSAVSAYNDWLAETAPTPNIDRIANDGMRFNNMFCTNSICGPSRASILTGKYAHVNGFFKNEGGGDFDGSQQTFPKLLQSAGYETAVIGKWHLSGDISHPNAIGIDEYTGVLGGGVQSYWNWNLVENIQSSKSTEYTTTKFTDLAINWIGSQNQPWFLWLAYNAPHTPFHLPPVDLHSQGNLPTDEASIEATPLPYYQAMIEAMDSEIGRLLESMSEDERDNTVIIFIGDNGTPNQVVQTYNSNRAKGSIYQGGVNVPMVISGKNVSRTNESDYTLINTTDLFATIADISGASISNSRDSHSFIDALTSNNFEGRGFVYTEKYNTQSQGVDYTIRNSTHKYIYFNSGNEALYNLSANPFESPNLLNSNQLPLSTSDSSEKASLMNELSIIRQD